MKKKKPSWAAVTERLALAGAAQQKGGLAVSVGGVRRVRAQAGPIVLLWSVARCLDGRKWEGGWGWLGAADAGYAGWSRHSRKQGSGRVTGTYCRPVQES